MRSMPRRCTRRRRPTSRRPKFTRWACTRSPRSAPSSTRSSAARAIRRAASASGSTALNKMPAQLYAGQRCRPRRAARQPQAGVKDMYARLPRDFATLPNAAARNPPRSAGDPGRRVERLLPPRRARWLTAGHLLHQSQGHRRLAEILAADAELSRRRSRPSPADQHRAGVEGHPDAAQARLLLGLFGRLGALCRAARRRAWRLCQRPARPRRLPPVLPVPRRAAGGRHRHPLQALEPRAGDRLYGQDHRLRAAALAARGRALLHDDRPGVQLQGRAHRLDPRPRRGAEDARGQVRHQALPRGAARRRDAAVDPRAANQERTARSPSAASCSAISATSSQRSSRRLDLGAVAGNALGEPREAVRIPGVKVGVVAARLRRRRLRPAGVRFRREGDRSRADPCR